MKNYLLTLFLFLMFVGCGSKKHYYTFGDTSQVDSNQTYTQNITVEKVEVPKYLKDNTLVKQITPYQVALIDDANWLTPMPKRLTNILISYLQQSLNNPNVYLYPWDIEKDSNKKISLKIKRFIAYNKEVILEANYKIYDLQSNTYTTRLFSTKVTTNNTIEGMMASMERAYFQLMEEIKNELTKSI